MEQGFKKKLFHICMIIVMIAAILFVVGILVLKYQVEGETNLPFNLSKISVISSADATDNEDAANRWNLTINQNNDIYMYIEKNPEYTKTEVIESVVVDNFNINKAVEKGEQHIYKPTQEETSIFKNAEANIADNITYTGDLDSNIKELKISNQGGIIALRFANNNISTYTSNDAQEINYNQLLKETNVTLDDIKATVSFDLTIKLASGKSYKSNITLDMPSGDVITEGTSSTELTDMSKFIFKRIENN